MDVLAEILAERLEKQAGHPLETQIVLTPNPEVKQWLSLEIVKRKGVLMGVRFLSVQECLLSNLLSPNRMELFYSLLISLKEANDPDLLKYVEGNEGRLEDLAEQLSSLFLKYGEWGGPLFDPHRESVGWQHAILRNLFIQGFWRSPVQILSEFRGACTQVHCFGIDSLPPIYWKSLFVMPLSIYLFSPSFHYWEDVCTDLERKKLRRFWKEKGASSAQLATLDSYLRDPPPLLANWGKLGRDTLKTLGKFPAEIELAHCAVEPDSLLKRVQFDLLHFQTEKESVEGDDSIEISLTGSSRLREVEVLRDGIFRLVEKGVEFSEISILAPDIQTYAPFIDLIFSDPECPIPYRLFGIDVRSKSPFSQGLARLASLLAGKWEVEEVLSLFETPAFYRKRNWEGETLERFRNWVAAVSIEWGVDGEHRKKILQKNLRIDPVDPDRKSWEKGLENLLNRMVFLFPETGSQFQVRAEDLEEMISLFLGLKERTLEFKGEKTLGLWAAALESLAEEYLMPDPKNEADSAALEGFRHFLRDLKQAEAHLQQKVFSFDPVCRFLVRPCPSQVRSSLLHAVRCSSIGEGALIPAKAVFLIGMEEGNFPRVKIPSSLDLLKQKENCDGPIPDSADQDRYLFLQLLFSAQEFLRISYCHLTPDEGKPINPSLLVQQFLGFLDSTFFGKDLPISESFSRSLQVVHPSVPFDARCFGEKKIRSYSKTDFLTAHCLLGPKEKLAYWPDFSRCPEVIFPEKEISIPISHLKKLARHPWRFYLQKIAGIFIEEEEIDSFSLQKSRALRASLDGTGGGTMRPEEGPGGIFGEALHSEINENAQEWKAQLAEWGVERPFSLHLLENGQPKEEGDPLERPAIELHWEGGFKARIFGEIKPVSYQGILSTYEDQVSGLLKIWPEALAAAIALNAPQILLLKSGKIKSLVCPEESLKRFVEYYLRALQSPTPLLPEWGDALLKKGAPELRKKMEATFSSKRLFEDQVIDWVALRGQIPDAEQISEGWGAYLKETFSDLICASSTGSKTRSKKGNSHDAV